MLDRILRSRALPKLIDGNTHALLDALTVSGFFMLAGLFWGRHKRAAATALINGIAVAGVSLFTDYPGGQSGSISFEDHGKADIMQAGMAAGMPTILGFGSEAAAIPFRMQAIVESLVIGMTDWDAAYAAEYDEEIPEYSVA
jgi:hypothetical protein